MSVAPRVDRTEQTSRIRNGIAVLWRFLRRGERGIQVIEVLLILALVILPLFGAILMLQDVLFFNIEVSTEIYTSAELSGEEKVRGRDKLFARFQSQHVSGEPGESSSLIDGFFRGCYQLLFIVGRPGLAKSYEFEQRLGQLGHPGGLRRPRS